MNVGIIGSGNIGSTLARNLKALGHEVQIANSRGPATLAAFAAETGVVAATVEQASGAADLVIIAIPQVAVADLPHEVLRKNPAVVVDAGNYYPTRDGVVAQVEEGATDSEWIASVLGRPVVKAFKTSWLRAWRHAATRAEAPDALHFQLPATTLKPSTLYKTWSASWGSMPWMAEHSLNRGGSNPEPLRTAKT